MEHLKHVFDNIYCGNDFTIIKNNLNDFYSIGNNTYGQLLRNIEQNKLNIIDHKILLYH